MLFWRFTAGGKRANPVLLNFQGNFDDVYNSYSRDGPFSAHVLSPNNQEITYSDYSIFVAEAVSTCNEALPADIDRSSPRIHPHLRVSIYRQYCFI